MNNYTKTHIALIMTAVCLLSACGKNNSSDDKASQIQLAAPRDLSVEQISEFSLQLNWTDASSGEKGFKIYLILPSDIDHPVVKGSVEAESTSYVITDRSLEAGKSYYVGVQAIAEDSAYNSKISKTLFTMAEKEDPNAPKASLRTESHDVCIRAFLTLGNALSSDVCGVCWCEEGIPDIESPHQDAAPLGSSDRSERTVTISNALLDYGKTYNFRAYLKRNNKLYYSESVECSLGKDIEAIELDWEKLSFSGLPSSVEVYSYDGLMNGRTCKAWYAVADISKGDVEFRVKVPASATTVDDQFKSDGNCLVMVNGGYFYNGRNLGIAYVNSTLSGSISAVRGSLKTEDEEYNEMYNITRGIFGVDKNGMPQVLWASSDASGSPLFFDRPLPSVKGEAKYAVPSTTNPTENLKVDFKYAQSAGPLLLKDGKCPLNFETTDKGSDYYISNYEIIPYDIYGEDVITDRTAAGYTAAGEAI
ncbi:MAG: fibronectin type III domain-containing protein, partial [Candidatus Cryptobacteroides sp.]